MHTFANLSKMLENIAEGHHGKLLATASRLKQNE
jgi:hypothetical protein